MNRHSHIGTRMYTTDVGRRAAGWFNIWKIVNEISPVADLKIVYHENEKRKIVRGKKTIMNHRGHNGRAGPIVY